MFIELLLALLTAAVIGGKETEKDEYPDCVAVGNRNGFLGCGTLIGSNVVVTADLLLPTDVSQIFIGQDFTKPDARSLVKVRKAIPFGKPNDGRFGPALLILDQPVYVKPRALATATMLKGAKEFRVVGFGAADPHGRLGVGTQRAADLQLRSLGEIRAEAVRFGSIVDQELVAGGDGKDANNGDAGAPLYVKYKDNWYLAGISTRAIAGSKAVAGEGGIFTRVDKFEPWIRKIAQDNEGKLP